MKIEEIRKIPNWAILKLFEEVGQLKKEVATLKKTKADKRAKRK